MSKSGASKKADESSPANEKSCDDSLDKEVKFDRELDWCIQKLNTRLLNEKDSKKAFEAQKCLNLLKNPSTVLVRKRQIMFSLFGDYRAKMKSEEKQSKSKQDIPKVTFTPTTETTAVMKSKFIKKSTTAANQKSYAPQQKEKNVDEQQQKKDEFKFNFQIEQQ